MAKDTERKETKFNHTNKDILIVFTTEYWKESELDWKSGAWVPVLCQISKNQSADRQFIIWSTWQIDSKILLNLLEMI